MSDRDAGMLSRLVPFLKISKRTARSYKISLSALGCRASMRPGMKIQKWAAIAALVFGTIAANDVAPTNAELETRNDKGFAPFAVPNYAKLQKSLAEFNTRNPDWAAS